MMLTDKLVIWLATGLLAICTIFFNMYLLLVIQRSYRKTHKLNPCDFIISAIAVASITLQILTYLWQTIDEIDILCLTNYVDAILVVLIFSVKLIVFWSTAFLIFYYGIKLVVEPVHCYTRIQEAILKHVHIVVALIYICGFANCVPLLIILGHKNFTSDIADCGTIMPTTTIGYTYIFYYILISDIMPCIMMVKSSISIMYHLAKHLQNMKASTNGAHGPKLGTQMRVIKMTLSLVVMFVIFVVGDMLTQATVVLLRLNTLYLIVLIASIYTTVSAAAMVYGKKSHWKELVASYNLFLDEYPCLSSLKVAEVKTEPHDNEND
ncbi:taste receptor [Triplophysa rosa]|uniref:Taste receptor type 2 n=1 Tax=Triplophysa rosa TaxID=992332 RepID=A0A9W7TIM5_TRIRA|nr:taste receptor [Triplophysa rosa]